MKKNYLNLGCGKRYHPDWVNMDISPVSQDVMPVNLSQGIPLPDISMDVIYHSHLIEHLRPVDAATLVRECYRVLRPGGILRIATPDLERICRVYLEKLETVLNGHETAINDYDWIVLEMYDQAVREKGGGDMLVYLQQRGHLNRDFVIKRIGEEGRNMMDFVSQKTHEHENDRFQWEKRLYSAVRKTSLVIKNLFLNVFFGEEQKKALEIGKFRMSGEIHQWMYDRFSLGRLLQENGFDHYVVQTAAISFIPNWADYFLDTTIEGHVNKPDSLFMEAVKTKEHN